MDPFLIYVHKYSPSCINIASKYRSHHHTEEKETPSYLHPVLIFPLIDWWIVIHKWVCSYIQASVWVYSMFHEVPTSVSFERVYFCPRVPRSHIKQDQFRSSKFQLQHPKNIFNKWFDKVSKSKNWVYTFLRYFSCRIAGRPGLHKIQTPKRKEKENLIC